jgi:hypothetical protein
MKFLISVAFVLALLIAPLLADASAPPGCVLPA